MAFITLILMKFLTEFTVAKMNSQMKKTDMRLQATRMKYMAQMSMARAGGGSGGSNK
jgi:hypothetical protein